MGDDFKDSIAMWISVEYGKLNINIRLLDFPKLQIRTYRSCLANMISVMLDHELLYKHDVAQKCQQA